MRARLTQFSITMAAIVALGGAPVSAQMTGMQQPAQPGQAAAPPSRSPSPAGYASAIVGGEWVKNAKGDLVYQGGKWLEVNYSRPMLRQRDSIFGTGDEYGKRVTGSAPVWRVGANATTEFKTEVGLVFDGQILPAGSYSTFVDLKAGEWTLIFSNWPRQKTFNADDKTALYGAGGYTPDKDALRVKMKVEDLDMRVDQLGIFFMDVTKDSGTLAIAWDKTLATAPFKVVNESVRPAGGVDQAAGAGMAGGAGAAGAAPQRPLSPSAVATAMVAGEWGKNAQGNPVYQGGKWIEISYSRPMLRQRPNIFGSGADYGKSVLAGAPVWRLGANQSTRIKTDVPLVFGGKTLPAGEYSMFVDLKDEDEWTLIFSNWPAQAKYSADDKTALWGSYGYTPDKDVLRVPLTIDTRDKRRLDQLTIFFTDVTKDAGKLVIAWDHTFATAPFTVGK